MSDAYYYFTATLPHLELDSDPPMSDEDFLKECERLLGKEDFETARRIIGGDRSDISIEDEAVAGIDRANRDFLNETVWLRTVKSHKETGDSVKKDRAGSANIIDAVQQATKETNPLAGQQFLDTARWRVWDEILMGQTTGLAAIIVYGLKLKTVNRYRMINSPKGREAFEKYQKTDLPLSCEVD